MRFAVVIVLLAALGGPAFAQTVDAIPAGNDDVSLRDYTSQRFEALQKIMDERDRQYAQRFEAQQEALNNALNAAKEAVANALQAAKEAVTKAEDAANKRFDSVNEFRQTLTDQAVTFMSKAEADARLKAMEEDVAELRSQRDQDRSRGEGQVAQWALIVGGVVVLIAIGGLIMNFSRRAPTKA